MKTFALYHTSIISICFLLYTPENLFEINRPYELSLIWKGAFDLNRLLNEAETCNNKRRGIIYTFLFVNGFMLS